VLNEGRRLHLTPGVQHRSQVSIRPAAAVHVALLCGFQRVLSFLHRPILLHGEFQLAHHVFDQLTRFFQRREYFVLLSGPVQQHGGCGFREDDVVSSDRSRCVRLLRFARCFAAL